MTQQEISMSGVKVGSTILSPQGIVTKVTEIHVGYQTKNVEQYNIYAVAESGQTYLFRDITPLEKQNTYQATA